MPVLVVADEELAAQLRERGVALTFAPELGDAPLDGTDVVVWPEPSRDVLRVLAAGCVLVSCSPARYGLHAGIDHLVGETPSWACDLVELVLATPDAFAAMRRFARITATQVAPPLP